MPTRRKPTLLAQGKPRTLGAHAIRAQDSLGIGARPGSDPLDLSPVSAVPGLDRSDHRQGGATHERRFRRSRRIDA